MKPRLLIAILLVVSWAVFVLAMVFPTVALIGQCVTQGEPPDGGYTFSVRQLGLFWRSLWLSATATILCLLVSLPGAYVVGGLRRLHHRPLVAASMLGLLLCPPMVYAFGWERILPAALHGYARCILVWALWSWPIPALLLGAGWSRVGRRAFESALIVTSPARAFLHVVLPLLLPYVLLSGLLLFLLYFNDYGVPHACLIQVYATELLGWAASSSRPVDTAWPSILPVAMTGVALLAAFVAWRRCATHDDVEVAATTQHHSQKLTAAAILCFAVSWLLPLGALVAKLASSQVMVEAFRIYGHDLAWSLGVAVLGAIASVGMGLGLAATRPLRAFGLAWAVAFAAVPGALIGNALVAAYNHDATWWIYDHWPIVALSFISRFGWIGVLTALLASASSGSQLVSQARIDGASWPSIVGRIQVAMNWPGILCGAGAIVALSVADVAASSLVRVPTFSPIAHVLIEKFHRFEDGMLISLSLWLVAVTIPPAIVFALALRRSR